MKKVFVFAVIFSMCSCQSLLIKISTPKSIKNQIKVLHQSKNDRTIVFFPMIHIGKPEYYKSARPIIDSLREEGYKVFYESVSISDQIDCLDQIEYKKKFRKIIGFSLEADREILPNEYKLKKYIIQDYATMGLNNRDEILDLGINSIIDSIENNFGRIKLDSCDLKTSLDEPYKCKDVLKDLRFKATNVYRDNYINSKLLDIDYKKIILIYGKMHWYFIYPNLIKNDYKLIKGKV